LLLLRWRAWPAERMRWRGGGDLVRGGRLKFLDARGAAAGTRTRIGRGLRVTRAGGARVTAIGRGRRATARRRRPLRNQHRARRLLRLLQRATGRTGTTRTMSLQGPRGPRPGQRTATGRTGTIRTRNLLPRHPGLVRRLLQKATGRTGTTRTMSLQGPRGPRPGQRAATGRTGTILTMGPSLCRRSRPPLGQLLAATATGRTGMTLTTHPLRQGPRPRRGATGRTGVATGP